MAEYLATVEWSLKEPTFLDGKYSRAHTWSFDGGVKVPASSSPCVVPVPWSDPSGVDPEEAFVASLASCHMLTFLFVAAKAGFHIDRYVDKAIGLVGRNGEKRIAVTKVTLHPDCRFVGKQPSREELDVLHHKAHEGCFIANSVKTEVIVEPVMG